MSFYEACLGAYCCQTVTGSEQLHIWFTRPKRVRVVEALNRTNDCRSETDNPGVKGQKTTNKTQTRRS